MNNTPLVSIIIPTYNRAHLIGETLDSVLAQTYENWECIIVDDGSTDNTDEVVGAYLVKDSRFQYHDRPKGRPKGANACRNYGFELSKGEYVNYLDSDDFLHEDTILTKMNMAKKNDSDIVISKHTRMFSDLTKTVGNFNVFEADTFYIDFILSRNSILIGDPLIKKNGITHDVRFDESLQRGQDHDYFIRLFEKKLKYCLIDSVLYYYKLTDNSITVKSGKGDKRHMNTQISIHKKMMDKYSDNHEIVEEYKRKTRKMYVSLIQKNKVNNILKNFGFYSYCFNKNKGIFIFYFFYNLITKRGFDVLKKL